MIFFLFFPHLIQRFVLCCLPDSFREQQLYYKKLLVLDKQLGFLIDAGFLRVCVCVCTVSGTKAISVPCVSPESHWTSCLNISHSMKKLVLALGLPHLFHKYASTMMISHRSLGAVCSLGLPVTFICFSSRFSQSYL